MTSKFWIKLYHEILNDPKMGRLPDHLFRRSIELFLLAGEYDRDGLLPPEEDIAFRLRISDEEIQEDLASLASVKIVTQTDQGWMVTKFKERQEPLTSTERWEKWKERQTKEKYYPNEEQTENQRTTNESLVEPDIDTDKNQIREDTEPEAEVKSSATAVFCRYEKNIGMITPTISEKLGEMVDHYPRDWILEAMDISAEQNKRSLAYFSAILKRWDTQGKDNGHGGRKKPDRRDSPEDMLRYSEWEDPP